MPGGHKPPVVFIVQLKGKRHVAAFRTDGGNKRTRRVLANAADLDPVSHSG